MKVGVKMKISRFTSVCNGTRGSHAPSCCIQWKCVKTHLEKFISFVLINLKRLLGVGFLYWVYGIFIIFPMAIKNIFSCSSETVGREGGTILTNYYSYLHTCNPRFWARNPGVHPLSPRPHVLFKIP